MKQKDNIVGLTFLAILYLGALLVFGISIWLKSGHVTRRIPAKTEHSELLSK